jgi:ABC-2 type transport system permease protein
MHRPDALRPKAGSLLWLVLHEIRLTLRSGKGRRGVWIRIVLVLLYAAGGIAAGLALRGTDLAPDADTYRIASAVLLTILSFMAAQVVIAAQRTLYEAGDLDLLLSSPLPENRVLAAKTLGLAGGAATTFAYLILPAALPVALLAEPRLLAVVPMLGALALAGASFGLGLAIILIRLLGPRGARATGQVLAALLGAMVFLISQLATHQEGVPRGRMAGLIEWMRETGWGSEGWSALPARAALGEPGPLALVVAFALALFTLTSLWFRRHFLLSYQKAGERGGPRRRAKAGGGKARNLFGGGLLRAILTKELRLIVRQPELLFMMVLRLIYLAPLALILARRDGGVASYSTPVLAAVGAVAAGQLTGSLAWLTISAEDAPDLLAVSPVDGGKLRRMKLLAALIMVAPFALIVPALIARHDAAAAAIALAGALAAGYGAGLIELLLGKPQKRSAFTRRQQGSFLVSILGLLATMFVGALTAAAVFFV